MIQLLNCFVQHLVGESLGYLITVMIEVGRTTDKPVLVCKLSPSSICNVSAAYDKVQNELIKTFFMFDIRWIIIY
jgi:hypothetical protein